MTEQAIAEILDRAERSLRIADHMIYITYPLIKENRLLKKVIEQLYDVANAIVKAVVQHEYIYKRLESCSENLETFKKCTSRLNITTQEIQNLEQLFTLMEKHRGSSLEFIRKEKLVIMSNNLRTESIGLEQLKQYLNFLKAILQKAKNSIKR